jgi:putative acetyltransferase
VKPSTLSLRAYTAADEAAAIELWRRTWQATYPTSIFRAPCMVATLAQRIGAGLAIMVVRDEQWGGQRPALRWLASSPSIRRLDILTLVVAPEAWGSEVARILIDAAKQVASKGLELHVNQDNVRAIGFYKKHGFAISGKDINARSGKPLFKMTWRA